MSCGLACSCSCRVVKDCRRVANVWVTWWMCWSHACSASRRGRVSVITQFLSEGLGAAWISPFTFADHLAADHPGIELHGPGEEGKHLAHFLLHLFGEA